MLNSIKFTRRGGFVKFYSDGGLKFCVRAASLVKFHNFAARALRRTGIFCVARFRFVKKPTQGRFAPRTRALNSTRAGLFATDQNRFSLPAKFIASAQNSGEPGSASVCAVLLNLKFYAQF